MVAVDEFELGAAPAPAPAPRRADRRRRSDRPAVWVALAAAAVAVGAFAAPATLPRASADYVEWGGLDRVTYVMVDGDIDAVPFARDAVGFFASYDAERRPTGTVVVLLRDVPRTPETPLPGVMSAADDALAQVEFDRSLFGELEAAAYRSDWVCEPTGDQAVCTALARPEITLTVDWRAP